MKKKKLGIALGGGGAKGFAHLGVLEVLNAEGIDFEIVSGTSIGSLVGACYATNSLESLAKEACRISITDIPRLLSPTFSNKGFFTGKNVLELLNQHMGTHNIEDLDIKFAAAATNLDNGSLAVFTTGDLTEAVRASIAIPLIFTPVSRDNFLFVDGGIVEPIPVEASRDLGADIVIAVDLFGIEELQDGEPEVPMVADKTSEGAMGYLLSISSKLSLDNLLDPIRFGGSKWNVLSILESTLATSQARLTELRLLQQPSDITLRPPVSSVGILDFHKGAETIEIGRKYAREHLDAIKKLID
jgi:NTE family protein